MKKLLLSILLVTIINPKLFAQDKMIVDKPCFSTYNGEFAKSVDSMNQLPALIKEKVENL